MGSHKVHRKSCLSSEDGVRGWTVPGYKVGVRVEGKEVPGTRVYRERQESM